ncbi:spindle assembly abnormal protein 6 homolog [Engraulis encrasicolus]|uniref:spindle assembly abnormal protein 6 homolog n=1 Tax=Engraulis encrasicolus TaxID=184585 RepID=UPI002FD0D064
MTEILFNKRLQVQIKCKDSDDRRSTIRLSVELQFTSNPIPKRELLVRLTDDADLFFLYNLSISEEDFQSLKVQQGLLVDFSSFPQRFTELLQQCLTEQDKDNPRFLLQLLCASSLDHGPASLNVVETNPFKHLTHLSLKLLHGNDTQIKTFLANCLSTMKEEKLQLEQKLKKTEEDLSRQLSFTQQTLAEKSRELDKLRSEWSTHTTSLTTRHTHDLSAEREKALEAQARLCEQKEALRAELESAHQRSSEALQSRLSQLETANRELTDKKYRHEATLRELKAKLATAEEECVRVHQQVCVLRSENSALDEECHSKERQLSQTHTRLAVLEQETRDKDTLLTHTRDALEAAQQQKVSVEGNAESKQHQIDKLETTVKSLSEELIKANSIIKRLHGDVKALMAKMKVKNSVMVSQEKHLQETQDKLTHTQTQLSHSQTQLQQRDQEVFKLKEQLEATVQKLDESREVLKTNENVITWLNKQLNENQLSRRQEGGGVFETPPGQSGMAGRRVGGAPSNPCDSRGFPLSSVGVYSSSSPALGYPITSTLNNPPSGAHTHPPFKVQFNPMGARSALSPVERSPPVTHTHLANKENGEPVGLDPKYLERRDDSIPLRGLLNTMNINTDISKPSGSKAKPGGGQTVPSAYFPG